MSIFNLFRKKKVEPKRIIDAKAHGLDPLFEDAARLVVQKKYLSMSFLQRKFGISYKRANRIADELVAAGILGPVIEPMIPREPIVREDEELYNLLAPLYPEINATHRAPLLGIGRLRIGTDGNGVTSLVAFHGCSLGCRFCLNPRCKDLDAEVRKLTPAEVMEEIKKDELYYIATKGGVTFGGGEPFLNSLFIKEVLDLGAKEWHVTIETSLNVPREYIEPLLPYIDEYIVDIKDMNTQIYESYTGKSNSQVKENLKWLVGQGIAERILCRIPLIPNYNNASDQETSKKELSEMGITRFEMFTYLIDKERESIRNKICKLKEEFRKIATRGIIDEE